MAYELRHFDTPLLRFEVIENTFAAELEIIWINEEQKCMLPLDLEVNADGLFKWLKHRTIPKNRAFVHDFLSKCGLNLNRPLSIIQASKGLSLNDCYWVVEEGFEGTFSRYNLYDNRFSQILALIAITGYGKSIRSSLDSCPEFTTNGMLPKCWRRENGKILLYKGGTTGAYHTGNEPYSEFYAAQIAKVMGIHAIDYKLSKWKAILCSTCELFTSKRYSYIPVGRIVRSGDMNAVAQYYQSLGEEYLKAFHDMLVFDAVVCNTDRHFGNFGFLVDNETNRIVAPAPLFDHGNALFNFADRDALASLDGMQEYADTLLPCVYDDFFEMAKKVMTEEHRAALRHLLTFRFKRHSRYNLPAERLKLIEKIVQSRARKLLE